MNRLIASALFAILALSSVQQSPSLLFSPLLLKANPWGIVAACQGGASSLSKTVKIPTQVPQADGGLVDFCHDEDLMRYKHELLGYVYEKLMTCGFGSQD